MARAWLMGALLAVAAAAGASDLAREQRLAGQVETFVLDGETLWLEAAGHAFLAVHMAAADPSSTRAAIVLHSRGMHPNWQDVVYPLRTRLPEHGWHTLAIQLPVLEKGAKYYDYVDIFPEAYPRLERAVAWLRDRGMETIVVVAHGCGVHMSMAWLGADPDRGIDAYVGIGMGATDTDQPMREPFPLADLTIPVLDVYGAEDHPSVMRDVPVRRMTLDQVGHPHSRQVEVPGADHDFTGRGDALVRTVAGWLAGLPE